MGKKRNRNGKGGGGRDRDKRQRGTGNQWDRVVEKNNAAFEKYYKHIVPEAEWDEFIKTCQTPLPATFRITGTRGSAGDLLSRMEETFFAPLHNLVIEGEKVPPPHSLPWYPDRLAWHTNATRMLIRKAAELKRFHTFLIAENDLGNVSRQEAVSMIPPMILDVQPHHKVLDMCAAPGSKTAQLIEFLHADDPFPTGLVIANDKDNKRCYMLTHQAKRLQSPNFLIVNHDAAMFPTLRLPPKEGETRPQTLLYDRVLCDVPCTGDGTMRKNITIWRGWKAQSAVDLNPLQGRILQRGLELTAVGGMVAYSTCSLNPIENEAVVAEALRKYKGAIELVDMSDKLPNLKRAPGRSEWPVMTLINPSVIHKYEEVINPEGSKLKPRMFSPTKEETEWMNLDRCWRLFPHLQDTGGFFVALFRKVAPLSKNDERRQTAAGNTEAAEATVEAPSVEDGVVVGSEEVKVPAAVPTDRKSKTPRYKEEPFLFMNNSEETAEITKFYQPSKAFPVDLLLTRSERGKNIYLVSQLIKDIFTYNPPGTDLRVVNSGLKVFTRSEKTDVPCRFRLSQEGVRVSYPYLRDTPRVIKAPKKDLLALITGDVVRWGEFTHATAEKLKALSEGCCVLSLERSEDDPVNLQCDVQFMGWRGRSSLRCLVARDLILHYRILFGDDPAPLLDASTGLRKTGKMKKDDRDAQQGNDKQPTTVAAAAETEKGDATPQAQAEEGETKADAMEVETTSEVKTDEPKQ